MKLPTLKYEKALWRKGLIRVAGVDEVGRGALAGPVVAAAVVFKPLTSNELKKAGLEKINDSKKLTPQIRENLSALIKKNAIDWSVSEISVSRINRHGIGKCSQYAFRKALKGLKNAPEHVLIDAFFIRYLGKRKQTPIIKGDTKSISIAAASIIAKTYRDKIMTKAHSKNPRYKFNVHKGYGTKSHRDLLIRYGACSYHRLSFNLGLGEEKTKES